MRKLGLAIALVLALVAGGVTYVWFSGGSGEPSSEVTAPPVATEAPSPPENRPHDPAAADPEESSPTSAAEPTTAPAPTTAPEPSTSAAPAPDTSAAGAVTDAEGPHQVVYGIDKAESTVRFEIDEILNGSPKRVVGVTDEVAGEALIDFGDPAASRLGAVVINVRTLQTDSSFRDRAMRGPILGSSRDENEFATFEPTGIEGLPGSVAVGDRVTLSISGDFTLSGVTRPVVFDTEVVIVSKDRLEVSGSARVLRSDFGLTIPDVPGVSDVADEVLIAFELVAVAG